MSSGPSGMDGTTGSVLNLTMARSAFSTTTGQSYILAMLWTLVPESLMQPSACGDGGHGLRPMEKLSLLATSKA